MNISYFNIALDIKETQSQVSIPMKRGCANYGVRITLVDGNKPYNITKECIALFSATKPDGAIIENNCTINKNKINYKVTDQTVAASGVLDCAIMLYGADEELLASAHFTIVVDERAVGDVPVSEDEKNFFDSMVTSEIARREAEAQRVEAETDRVLEENWRRESENGRAKAEDERIVAEALRDADEHSRNTAEKGRVTAENQRVKAENGRVSAEKSRVNRFAKMESEMEEHLEDLDSRYRLGTQEMVNKWLDEHPEATTTVQDHSLFLDAFVFGELGYVTPQMFKGKYDEDDTASIQYALDFAHDNNIGEVYIPAGTYRVNGIESTNNRSDRFACGLVIRANTKLIMDKNAVLKMIPNGHTKSCVLRCDYSATNIEITGGQIIGDRKEHYGAGHSNNVITTDGKYMDGEHGMGIYVGGNENVKISNCIIKDCWGDGIIVTLNSDFTLPSTNILIDNVVIDNARRNGISLVGVSGCTISNSIIKNTNGTNPQFGIDIEASPYECNTNDDILIINSKFESNARAGIGSVGTSKINANNIKITDCVFNDNTEGIMFGSIEKVTITKSSFNANKATGVSLSGINGFIVSDCIVNNTISTNVTNGSGLFFYGKCSGVVEKCILDGNECHGIHCNKCQDSGLIIRSCISKNNTKQGIYIHADLSTLTEEQRQEIYNNAIPILVDGCECRDNNGSGISVFQHPKTKINNCMLLNNVVYGVLLHTKCDNSIVSNCSFEGNYANNNSGNDLGCYNNSNSKIINNTFRVGNIAHTHSPMVIGYYNSTTENTFISENDFRGMGANIKEVTSGTGVVTTGTIYGKNIKNDGTYA